MTTDTDTDTTDRGFLLAVRPDGSTREFPNNYEGIKDALDDAWFDFAALGPTLGGYVDDEGMLKGLALNVPVACLTGRALFGTVVLSALEPDAAGDTLPPPADAVRALRTLGALWGNALSDAAHNGQTFDLSSNPETVPGPTIIGW